eukprot:363094_1
MPTEQRMKKKIYTQQIEELRFNKSSKRTNKKNRTAPRYSENEIIHMNKVTKSRTKQTQETDVSDKYKVYINNIEEHIEKRPDMVPLVVYDQQRINWTKANDKLHEQIRQLKEVNEEQNRQLIQYENNQEIQENAIQDLTGTQSTLKAKIDELESLIYAKDDELEIISEKLNHLHSEYEARDLAKDKMIESLKLGLKNKNDEVEEMKGKIEELGEEFDATIQEFNDENDVLLKRNEKLKAQCKELLKKQVEDMEERGMLLKKIQSLQMQKANLRRQFTETTKVEVSNMYGNSDDNEQVFDENDVHVSDIEQSHRYK